MTRVTSGGAGGLCGVHDHGWFWGSWHPKLPWSWSGSGPVWWSGLVVAGALVAESPAGGTGRYKW